MLKHINWKQAASRSAKAQARARALISCCISLLLLMPGASALGAERFEGVIGRTDKESRPHFEAPRSPKSGSPDVLVIVIDDMGFSDLGSFGSEISTPNLDRLALQGLRYNNFHTRAICSPTRAALLTGRNSHSVGVGNVVSNQTGFPANRGEITHAAATLAEILQAAGYNTYALGKYHVMRPQEVSIAGPFDQWPLGRGFDRFYGFLDGMTDMYHPELVQDNTFIDTPRRPGYHLTEDLIDRAISWAKSHTSANPQGRMFMYIGLPAVHGPHQAPKEFVDKYIPVFEKGWDRTREDRLARQKKLGIVPANTALPPRNPGVKAWDELTPDEQRLYVRLQAAYAGFLEHTDLHIGRLLQALEALGRLDNTLTIVLSDNGASTEGYFNGTLNEVSTVARLTGGPQVPSGETVEEMLPRIDEIGSETTFPNYPIGWAMASNTPFRFYKQTMWAGGEQTPLLVHWPRGLQRKGEIRDQFVDVIDVMPTVLDILELEAPKEYKGVEQMPLHGKSFRATFGDPRASAPRTTQYFELWGQRALWHEGWKAVSTHKRGDDFANDTWELFDKRNDFSESKDLSKQHPEKLKQLQDLWWAEAEKYGVLPLDGRMKPEWDAARTAQLGPGRTHFEFYPGQEYLGREVSPHLADRSFSLVAHFDDAKPDAHGILLSRGDRFGGFVFYLDDGKPVFEHNDFGRNIVFRSTDRLPSGASEVRYEFVRTGKYRGTGTLSISGKVVAQQEFQTIESPYITGLGGTSVGRHMLSPVSESYAQRGEFALTNAQLRKIVLDVQPTQP